MTGNYPDDKPYDDERAELLRQRQAVRRHNQQFARHPDYRDPEHPESEEPEMSDNLAAWAVDRWKAEVENRPLINRNRRTLDDTWRQVIRHLNPEALGQLGPCHDDLIAGMQPKLDGHRPVWTAGVTLHELIVESQKEGKTPAEVVIEAASAGYKITEDVAVLYAQHAAMAKAQDEEAAPAYKVNDPVTIRTPLAESQGNVVSKFRGHGGVTLVVVAEPRHMGWAYEVYPVGCVSQFNGMMDGKKAERYDKLAGMEGHFDSSYDNYLLEIPVPENVEGFNSVEQLLDRLEAE